MVKIRDKRNGKEKVLLNPSEKGEKYARELRENMRYTNDKQVKKDKKTGEVLTLDDVQRAYRGGYLDAQKDAANCYKSQQAKKQKAGNAPVQEKTKSSIFSRFKKEGKKK